MTMEERSTGIDDGAPVISTGACTTTIMNNSNKNTKSTAKMCEITSDASYPLQRKRSFDVAFLVAPDEKMLRRQTEKLAKLQYCANRLMNDAIIRHQQHHNHHQERRLISRESNSYKNSIADDNEDEDNDEFENKRINNSGHNESRIPQNLTIKHFEDIEVNNSKYNKARRTEDTAAVISPYPSPKQRSRLTPTTSSLSISPEPVTSTHQYNHGPLVGIQKSPSPPSIAFQRGLQPRKLFLDDSPEKSINNNNNSCDTSGDSRSAFTKVNLTVQRQNLIHVSPNSSSIGYDDGTSLSPRSSSSISPDVVAYQNSLSPPIVPSATTSSSPGACFPGVNKFLGPPGCFAGPAKMAYPFLLAPEACPPSALLDNIKLAQQQQQQRSPPPPPPPPLPPKISSPKMTPVASSGSGNNFRPELPAAVYPSLPAAYGPLSTVFPPIGGDGGVLSRPRLLAAASLLPSSLAALALPAQNVCAKCNLSFRMTSDLVYHMRSHHKNESLGESARRRREEKLRCPVCDESFRERHHLTRHMTAHQDKESDAVVDQAEIKRRAAAVTGSTVPPAALVHSGTK